MLTDLDTIKNLLTHSGIAFAELTDDPSEYTVIRLLPGTSFVVGDDGCSTEFYFNENDNLVSVGAYL